MKFVTCRWTWGVKLSVARMSICWPAIRSGIHNNGRQTHLITPPLSQPNARAGRDHETNDEINDVYQDAYMSLS